MTTTRVVWSPVDAPPLPRAASERLKGRKIAVLGRNSDSVNRLIERLHGTGATARHYAPEPGNATETARAFRREAGSIDGIIDLNLDTAFSFETANAWEEPLRSSVALLQAYYDDWLEEDDSRKLFYLAVTRMGGKMGYGAEPIRQPLGGIWAGLAKTLPQEIPNCNVRVLDLAEDDFPALDQIIVRELYRWGLFEIGYQGGTRYTISGCPQEVGSAARISSADTVLLSGGARGIGFALACSLVRECGCHVVATGRDSVPDLQESLVAMSSAEFKSYQQELLRSASRGGNLAAIRARIERESKRRELYFNLKQAASEGLTIEYRKCDVTNEEEVRTLVHDLGRRLSIVVHNAGIDSPVRLPLKSPDAFIKTVTVKVQGFVNLLRAVDQAGIRMFCNVGSMTGRWGGMTGETDYAAANEGLSRLGMWAARRLSFPVKTLCWPTWERLGMIKNFEVATKYMSPLSVDEGLKLWRKELSAPDSGEVTFLGRVGQALNPVQIKGFLPTPGVPNIEMLCTHFHYLGDVLSFRPFRSIRTTHMISARAAPALDEFRAYGREALPVSLLLEQMVGVGTWVQAEGWKQLALAEVRDIAIQFRGLIANEGTCVLEHSAEGSWTGKEWQVRITVRNLSGNQEAARATLIYRAEEAPIQSLPALPAESFESEPQTGASNPDFVWRGFLIERARWWNPKPGARAGTAAPCHASDLWSTPYPPVFRLPVAHLENIFRAALEDAAGLAPVDSLHIRSIRLTSSAGPAHTLLERPEQKQWWVGDRAGNLCAQITDLDFHRAFTPRSHAESEHASVAGRVKSG